MNSETIRVSKAYQQGTALIDHSKEVFDVDDLEINARELLAIAAKGIKVHSVLSQVFRRTYDDFPNPKSDKVAVLSVELEHGPATNALLSSNLGTLWLAPMVHTGFVTPRQIWDADWTGKVPLVIRWAAATNFVRQLEKTALSAHGGCLDYYIAQAIADAGFTIVAAASEVTMHPYGPASRHENPDRRPKRVDGAKSIRPARPDELERMGKPTTAPSLEQLIHNLCRAGRIADGTLDHNFPMWIQIDHVGRNGAAHNRLETIKPTEWSD